tara:strand:- start:2143 stop:2790 length:648 start_codon:yes stop_codon:yes gene_type:complete
LQPLYQRAMGSDRRHRHGPYRFYAPIYDMVFSSRLKGSYRGMYSALDLGHGDTVLEVGVGTGASLDFCPVGVKVEAIDFSEPMLEKARARIDSRADAPEVSFTKMDAHRLEFPDRHFDHSLVSHALAVVADPESVLWEMKRVTKPSGKIVIVNHYKKGGGALISLFNPIRKRLGLGMHVDFESMISECGLEIELTKKIGRSHRTLFVCVHSQSNE